MWTRRWCSSWRRPSQISTNGWWSNRFWTNSKPWRLIKHIRNGIWIRSNIWQKSKTSRFITLESGEDINNNFKIDIKTENCKLFLAKKALNVTIKESPAFIKNRLMACGIRPINNVVDISNYVMLELGQPLHFYDADRLGNCLQVRMAENGKN